MRKFFFLGVLWIKLFALDCVTLNAQTVKSKLQKAYEQFESDAQLKHAVNSLYVVDAKTGKVVFDKNSQVGLAPASTQKIIVATTAFELLGKDYRYKTDLGYYGKVEGGLLTGSIYLIGRGDPTFGSWRFENTKREIVDNLFIESLRKEKINFQRGSLIGITNNFESQERPGGWIWEDIGNYYGAGPDGLNWNENQFDLFVKPGRHINDSVKFLRTNPPLTDEFLIELKTGAKGSGDNGYIYFNLGSPTYVVTGTVPCCDDSFAISGAAANGNFYTLNHFAQVLEDKKFKEDRWSFHVDMNPKYQVNPKIIYTFYSPPLDSIIYWFLQKSINLYGEALVKTFAYEKNGFGSADTGILIVKDFWKQKGLDPGELNLKDGSGLSPQNRVTTHAQVEVLKYAKKQSWFPYFLSALPEYNNMKMKSGTITDVKGFCGYHTAGDGTQYVFSFLVNNYSGSASAVVQKMYKVLDVLK